MSDLIIIGGGGHAKVVIDAALKCGHNILGFLDDNINITEILGYRRLGGISDCTSFSNKAQFVIAIGNNKLRREIFEKYNLSYATIIHPSTVIGNDVVIGDGTVIMAGAVINASARVGKHSIINTSCVVEHDVVIGDFTMLAPHSTVCGFSKIGSNCWLGAGATVNNVLTICDDVTIGSGSVAISDIKEASTYIGVPAKKI